MYGYIYITTNTINNKKYIGQHKGETFCKGYKGSGSLLIKAFDEFGWDNFTCEPIEWCNSQEELNEAEIKWINYYNAVYSGEFYNLADGGRGYNYTKTAWNKGKKGMYHATSQKQLDALEKGRRKPASPKLKAQLSARRKGIIVSDETRKKCSEAAKKLKGYVSITNGEHIKRVHPDKVKEFLDQGYVLGGQKTMLALRQEKENDLKKD